MMDISPNLLGKVIQQMFSSRYGKRNRKFIPVKDALATLCKLSTICKISKERI